MTIYPSETMQGWLAARNRLDLMTGFEIEEADYERHLADTRRQHPRMTEAERADLAAYTTHFHANAPHNAPALDEAPHVDATAVHHVRVVNAQIRDAATTRATLLAATEDVAGRIAAALGRSRDQAATERATSAATVAGAVDAAAAFLDKAIGDHTAAQTAELARVSREHGEGITGGFALLEGYMAEAAAAATRREKRRELARWIQIAVLIGILATLWAPRAHAQGSNGIIIRGSNGASVLVTRTAGLLNFKCDGTTVICNWSASLNTFTITSAGGGAVTHIVAGGTSPVIASGFGTLPSIAGKDSAFQVTIGTGGATDGVVTFGGVWGVAPLCIATFDRTDNNDAIPPIKVVTTTTAATVTYIGAFSGLAENFHLTVLCIGI